MVENFGEGGVEWLMKSVAVSVEML